MTVLTRCSKCHEAYPQGKVCPKCSKRNQNYNKKRGAEVNFYTSPKWRNTRKYIIDYYNNIDIFTLGLIGKLVPCHRTVVHHIVPYNEDKKLALDKNNLVCLSTASHSLVHDMYDSGQREEAIEIINKGIALFDRLKNGNYGD